MIDMLSGLNKELFQMTEKAGRTSASFATSVADKIAQSTGLAALSEAAPETVDQAALADKSSQLKQLETALGKTADYLSGKFGDNAANAMFSLIEKRLDGGNISEESLGRAFMDAIKFVDQNFGVTEGDAFIEHLNGSLNESMNAFFDNGMNEKFMASTTPVNSAAASAVDMRDQLTESYVNTVKAMLEDIRTPPIDTKGARNPYRNAEDDRRMLQGVLIDQTV